MAILSIGELLGIGPSELSGLVPYSSLEYSGSVITGISGSAIGGQGGGSDPSTISAIASAYAESAASSKVDQGTFDSCCSAVNSALSGISAAVSGVTGQTGTYLPASASGDFQPSGDYAYNSSVSGKLDGSASSTWYPKEGNPSGYLTAHQSLAGYATETYVDSSVSGKQDASGMSAYALSSNVSAVIDTVSANSASWGGGGGTGDYVEKSALNVNIGSGNTSTDGSFVAGVGNSASGSIDFGLMPFVYGSENTAEPGGVAFGWGNIASAYDFVQGSGNRAFNNNVFAQGCGNYGNGTCFVQGWANSAEFGGFAQGEYNSASHSSFAQGSYNSAKEGATAFGTYNLRGDGSTSTGNSAAFAIGDGTGTAARHDLMLVTKDGEITMYSSTADTVGTGIMSSIRAISAAATGGGGGGGVDSATVSAIASSYAESAVSGVVGTVSANSASWGGGGGTGDYVRNSSMSVMIGSANSALYTALIQGYGNYGGNCSFSQGSANTGKIDSLAQGSGNSAISGSVAQGYNNSASRQSFAQGSSNNADSGSMAQGSGNSASGYSFARGAKNSAREYSFAQGISNYSISDSLAEGSANSATNESFALGVKNSANDNSFAQGSANSATHGAFAFGVKNSASWDVAVFGRYNLHGDGLKTTGDSAAFAIGDGVATARHDLMLVTKDGEIRMYSGSSDTAGLPLVATLRALSAWATANGWTGM